MAERSGGNSALAFIVGALLVIVLVIAGFMFFNGGFGGQTEELDVNIEAPRAPDLEAPNVNPPEVSAPEVTPDS